MAESLFGGTGAVHRPLTPPDHHDLPLPTDEERSNPPNPPLSKKAMKKKNKKKAARTGSISSHTTGDQNGTSESAHHAGSLPDVVGVMPPSPEEPLMEEPDPLVKEPPPRREERVEEKVVVQETTVIDPDGDVVLVLTRFYPPPAPEDCEVEEDENENENESEEPAEPPRRYVRHVVVSSRHLSLASPVFKKLIQESDLAEARTSKTVTIDLPDDDEDAMLAILNIIHSRDLEIRRSASLYELTQIAMLVDKYDMVSSTSFVARTWVEALKDGVQTAWHAKKRERGRKTEESFLPTEFGPDLLRWLFISWVFCLSEIFAELSKIAAMQSSGRIDEHTEISGLNFPKDVVDAIDSSRESAVEELLSIYSKTVDRYWTSDSDETVCVHGSQLCDSNVLGSLLFSGKRAHLYPSPSAPFPGLSFRGTQAALSGISFPPCPDRRTLLNDPSCSPGDEFTRTVSSAKMLERKFTGLEVRDFLPSSRKDLFKMPGDPGLW